MVDDTKPLIPDTHFAVSKQTLAIISVVAFMAIMLAKQFGWISETDAAKLESLRQMLLAQQQYQTVSVAETSGGKTTVTTVTDGKPVVTPVTNPPAASIDFNQIITFINSDQGKQTIAIIKDIFTPKVDPNPKPQPDPSPNPSPSPNPQPTPQPTGMRLVLTDSTGAVITSPSIAVGKLGRVMAVNAPSKIGWKASDHGGTADVYALPQKLGYDFVLKDASAYVEITAFDSDLNQVSLRVNALTAPMPPPNPNPDPDGGSNVTPSKQRKLSLSVVEDTQNRSADTAVVLRPVDVWNSFRDKGHDWRFYDRKTTEQKGKLAVSAAGAIEPALVIRDLNTGELLTVVPLPKTISEVSALVSKWSGGA